MTGRKRLNETVPDTREVSMETSCLESRRTYVAEVLCKQGQDSHMTATDLEKHWVCAIAARSNGWVQTLSVQVLGGRIVLHGFAGSNHSIQLAVAGLSTIFSGDTQ